MRKIIKVSCCVQELNERANLVYVKFDPAYYLELRKLVSPLFASKNFYAASFYDSTPIPFYHYDLKSFYGMDIEDLNEPFDVPDDFPKNPKFEPFDVPDDFSKNPKFDFRADCSMVRIKNDGILWTFYDKYDESGILYETDTMYWSDLEQESK